jgi:general secretion pathway protein D
MNRLKAATAHLLILVTLASCGSFGAYKKAQSAELIKDWDVAVIQYEKALEIDPGNRQYKVSLERAKRESSRAHFERGKSLKAAADSTTGPDQSHLAQLAAQEFQITVRLDPTNQFAAVELTKAVQLYEDIRKAASEQVSIDDIKKRAQSEISKAQPPQLNPASDEPISLTFSHDTPVKDIYRALGNAFGINVLFDQAIKDDRITIELRDVTAQAALERVMQAANHFYKVLDEKTIIVVPDNPQARRDYEDLVIRTFYLSNGDAEQVTNVVRTMIEARNVFPLKALNAITIRDTADKVRIAEKIIEANDKAKAEVVVQVELVELNVSRIKDIGMAITGASGSQAASPTEIVDGKRVPFTGGTLNDIARVVGSLNDLRNNVTFTIPAATYSLLKSLGNSELLANPELRISEGEKATLHIGQRIPVPVTTIQGYNPGSTTGNNPSLTAPYTSFQYQDVGIKVGIEPRVHHNREVTLKLTVEVSNPGENVTFAGQTQPSFQTRTIESTIRLKDGETNFLAGLIQQTKLTSSTKTPFLGDIPFIGRLFTRTDTTNRSTDLVLTMTPHIIRIPDITPEDLAPMWVGTGNNLTFRGVSPRIESQGGGGDPFLPSRSDQQFNPSAAGLQLAPDGEPGNYIQPEGGINTPPQAQPQMTAPASGMPNDPFKKQEQEQPPANNPPETSLQSKSTTKSISVQQIAEPETAALRLAPRIAPQPSTISLSPGETKLWSVIGMDLAGLTASQLSLRYDPRAMDVTDISVGTAIAVNPALPPVVTVNRDSGTILVKSSDGKPLTFISGGEVLVLRVHGGVSGDTFLVMDSPELRAANGVAIPAAISGGRAKVQ